MPGTLLHELRFAFRTLVRRKGATTLAVLSAGVAIGATTAVHSTVDWLLNRPPGGVVEPDRLMTLRTTDGQSDLTFAFTQYEQIRRVQDVFSDLAAYAKISGVISTEHRTDQVVFEFVTGNYFRMLGLRVAQGRAIGPEDDVAGGVPAVMLSDALWQSHFGGDPALIDRTITLNSQLCRVVGILPRDFEGYSLDWNGPTSVWLPVQSYTALLSGSSMLTRVGQNGVFFPLIGRLNPGVTREAALGRAQSWVPLLTRAPADQYRPHAIVLRPSSDTRIGAASARTATRSFFNVLLAVCGLVLLAACFNIANFLLGRAVARRGEMALRMALGASRWRVARQLLLEAGVIGAAAAVVGMAVAVLLIQASATLPRIFLRVPVTTEAVIDGRLALLAAALGLGSAIVFGLIPAVLASVRQPLADLKNPRPGWNWSGVRVSARQLLLVLQVALSVVLALAAGLYLHSLARIASIDSGYRSPEQVLVARVVRYGLTPQESALFHEQLLASLNTMPGVVSASIGVTAPFVSGRSPFTLPGSDRPPVEAGTATIGPRYFETLGIPVVAGREFDGSQDDLENGVIVNRILADRLWPGQPAVGQRVMYGSDVRTVTGVAAEERCRGILESPEPCAYRPFAPISGGYLRVRGPGDAMALAPRLRALVRELHPRVAVADEKSLADHIRNLTAAERMSAVVTAGLAVLGMALLATGCVSLFVSMVRDSVREIAIRMALGATHRRLALRILLQGAAVTVAGVAVGLVATRLVAARLADQLHDVSAWDPVTWVTVPLLVGLVSLVSVYWAARMVSRTDPARLLRAE